MQLHLLQFRDESRRRLVDSQVVLEWWESRDRQQQRQRQHRQRKQQGCNGSVRDLPVCKKLHPRQVLCYQLRHCFGKVCTLGAFLLSQCCLFQVLAAKGPVSCCGKRTNSVSNV
jgi:hypothetical protein